jgi:predicted nucleic acid-binding protein
MEPGGTGASGKLRVYADTSVFGGALDDEFAEASVTFLDQVREGRFALVTSTLVAREVVDAPEEVRRLFADLTRLAEFVEESPAALRLQAAYVAANVVAPQWAADALHVAIATVSGCAAVVSWNHRHIVHVQKAPRYNAVNALHGHPAIAICTPAEVIEYEEEEEV